MDTKIGETNKIMLLFDKKVTGKGSYRMSTRDLHQMDTKIGLIHKCIR